MDIKICPYCNRNYTDTYTKPKPTKKEQYRVKEYSTADLDHFYSQNQYPYLALSLYNFIPSCSICNRNFKGDNVDPKELLYLYDEEFGDDCYFEIGRDFLNAYVRKNDNFDIELSVKENIKGTNKGQKIENNIREFNLLSVYQNHKDDAKDILNKKYLYVDSYVQSLKSQFGIDVNIEELIFGVYESSYDTKKTISNLSVTTISKNNVNSKIL